MKKHKGMAQKLSGDSLHESFRQSLKECVSKSDGSLAECYNRLIGCEKLSSLTVCMEQNHIVLKEDLSYRSYLQDLFQYTAVDKDVCKLFQSHVTKKCKSCAKFRLVFEESILDYYRSSRHNPQLCCSILRQLMDSAANSSYYSLLMNHTHIFLHPVLQYLCTIPEIFSSSNTDQEILKTVLDNCKLTQQCITTSYNMKRAEEQVNPVLMIESDIMESLKDSLQTLDFSAVISSQQSHRKELYISLLTISVYITILLCKQNESSKIKASVLELLKRSDSMLYRFVLIRSILSMKSPELNSYCQPYLSPAIRSTKLSKREDPDVTYIMRTLCMWTQSYTRYDVTLHTQMRIQTDIECIYGYIDAYWDWYNNTIRELCEEIFTNILVACKREDLKEATLPCLRTILSNVARLPWTLKRKYRYLVIYIRIFGISDYLHLQYPDIRDHSENTGKELRCKILDDVLHEINNQQLSNYVGNLISMMVQHDTSFSSEKWVELILVSITHKPHSHETFSKYIIPKLNKHLKDVNILFLDQLTSSTHNSDNIRLVLLLAKQARSTGHLKEGIEGDKWCGIIDDSTMKSALKHSQCEVRMDCFALLCNAHKTTTPILQKEFDWVLDFVNINTFHEEPSFRQQIISNLKHFFYHILESGRKTDETRSEQYTDFIRKLMESQTDYLELESLPARRTCALEILAILTEILPDYFQHVLHNKKTD